MRKYICLFQYVAGSLENLYVVTISWNSRYIPNCLQQSFNELAVIWNVSATLMENWSVWLRVMNSGSLRSYWLTRRYWNYMTQSRLFTGMHNENFVYRIVSKQQKHIILETFIARWDRNRSLCNRYNGSFPKKGRKFHFVIHRVTYLQRLNEKTFNGTWQRSWWKALKQDALSENRMGHEQQCRKFKNLRTNRFQAPRS